MRLVHALVPMATLVLGTILLPGCWMAPPQNPNAALPLAPGDPHAYTEAYLARHPDQALSLNHTGVFRLTAVSAKNDVDTAIRDGVHVVPYYVAAPTALTFRIDNAANLLHHVVLRDAFSRALLTLKRGDDATTVSLQPGFHTLELYHVSAGDPNGQKQVIFLRPVTADAGPASKESATAQPSNGQTLEASSDCVSCNFVGADLSNQDFSNLNLSQSSFENALMQHTVFVNATLQSCNFTGPASIDLGSGHPLYGADFSGADASSADFRGIGWNSGGHAWPPQITFRGANLSNAKLGASLLAGRLYYVADLLGADFTGANLQAANLGGAALSGSTFRGANLTNATFVTPADAVGTWWFAKQESEPLMTQLTMFNGSVNGITTILEAANFSPDDNGNPTNLQGVNFGASDLTSIYFMHANLAQAQFTGPVQGADFTHATLTGIGPESAFWQSLAGTNFSYTALNGLHLEQADFTGAILSDGTTAGFADFTGAILSDGAGHGVNLTNQSFPEYFAQFSGASMQNATLDGVQLVYADLSGVDLANGSALGANFAGAGLPGAILRNLSAGAQSDQPGVLFTKAFMPNTDLSNADLRNADFSGAHVYTSTPSAPMNFTGAKLDNATFDTALAAGAIFDSTSLAETNFEHAYLTDATFNSASLVGTTLESAYLEGADFTAAQVGDAGVKFTSATFSINCPSDPSSTCIFDPSVGNWSPHNSWTLIDQNGVPIPFSYGPTILDALQSGTGVTWPDGTTGAFDTAHAQPLEASPYPPAPPCVSAPPCYCNCSNTCGPNGNKRPCQ